MHRLSKCTRNRVLLLFVFVFVALSSTWAQQQLGMRVERYAGIYSASVNPAYTAYNPQRWDLSLGAADFYFDNSYAYLRNTSVGRAIRGQSNIFSIADTSGERPIPANAIVQDFYNVDRPMYAVVQARVSGPAFSAHIGEQHTIGLVTALRSQTAIYRIPGIFRYSELDAVPRFQEINVPNTQLSTMSWAELGLHYAFNSTDNAGRFFSIGATPKLLMGYEAASLRGGGNVHYTRLNGDTVAIAQGQADYALTLGNVRSDSLSQAKPRINGWGGAVDLGFSWAMPADDGDTDADYLWRLGISLLDVGAVRFNKDAQRHRIVADSTLHISGSSFDGAQNVDAYIADLSQAVYGNPSQSLQANAFSMSTPTALSVQFDYRIVPGLYTSAVWVQRIPLGRFATKAPNVLAIAPRYEHRWFSATVPVVLTDWSHLHYGLALRLGYLTLGSENLGSFLGQKALSGADFYIGLKVNGFSLGDGKSRSRSGGSGMSRSARRKIKCYEF